MDVLVDEQESMDLPPGFRFHPTDEELITHYLSQKVIDINFSAKAIGEVDLNKCEPWDLPSMLFFMKRVYNRVYNIFRTCYIFYQYYFFIS